jgi:hypothetical protein
VWQRVVSVLVVALLVLVALTTYRNVFADDRAVRAQAEKVARDRAGCGSKCAISRIDGSRGILSETLTYTLQTGPIIVTCRRAYIAFGSYACAAAKP